MAFELRPSYKKALLLNLQIWEIGRKLGHSSPRKFGATATAAFENSKRTSGRSYLRSGLNGKISMRSLCGYMGRRS